MLSAEVVELERSSACLTAALAAARRAEALGATTPPEAVVTGGGSVDTSGMPGGADSAPVSENAPEPAKPVESAIAEVEQTAEADAIDILQELKAGTPVAQVADKLLDQNGLRSIVKAIGDLAGKIL